MLPEHLFIIRKILIEKKLHHSFDRLNEIFYNLLTKHTRQLYRDGFKTEYAKAVEFEIDNSFSLRNMSHAIASKMAEKMTHYMKVNQVSINELCFRTGLTKSVVETCLKGHGSFENIVQIATHIGVDDIFYISSWRSLFEESIVSEKKPVMTIETIDKEFYDHISSLNESRIKGDFSVIGGLFDFDPIEVEDDLLLTVTGKLAVHVDENNKLVSNPFHYVGLKLRVSEELRKLLVRNYERNSHSPAVAIDFDHTVTVKRLLNSLIMNPIDESNDACALIYLSVRIREDLTVVDKRYNFTFYIGDKLKRLTIKFANEFIDVIPYEPEDETPNEEEIDSDEQQESPVQEEIIEGTPVDDEIPTTEEENVEENTEQEEQPESPVQEEING